VSAGHPVDEIAADDVAPDQGRQKQIEERPLKIDEDEPPEGESDPLGLKQALPADNADEIAESIESDTPQEQRHG
jgi:hypothetical protein